MSLLWTRDTQTTVASPPCISSKRDKWSKVKYIKKKKGGRGEGGGNTKEMGNKSRNQIFLKCFLHI